MKTVDCFRTECAHWEHTASKALSGLGKEVDYDVMRAGRGNVRVLPLIFPNNGEIFRSGENALLKQQREHMIATQRCHPV